MADERKRLQELTLVRLKHNWVAMVELPKGFAGTIVAVHPIGGYEVEFSDDGGRGFTIGVPDNMVERRGPDLDENG